jgi:hypothetical protein
VERRVERIRSTKVGKSDSELVADSNHRRPELVPPAGFEPALPPPETGRCRDHARLSVSYLGFLFASCVSGGRLRAVVRSTKHSTMTVLIGRFEALVLGEVGVVLDVARGERLGDLRDRLLALPGDRDHVTAELLRERLGHSADPSGEARASLDGVNRGRAGPLHKLGLLGPPLW